jgi:hypothetical protein
MGDDISKAKKGNNKCNNNMEGNNGIKVTVATVRSKATYKKVSKVTAIKVYPRSLLQHDPRSLLQHDPRPS